MNLPTYYYFNSNYLIPSNHINLDEQDNKE